MGSGEAPSKMGIPVVEVALVDSPKILQKYLFFLFLFKIHNKLVHFYTEQIAYHDAIY